MDNGRLEEIINNEKEWRRHILVKLSNIEISNSEIPLIKKDVSLHRKYWNSFFVIVVGGLTWLVKVKLWP